ncbi:hypothetical protein HJG60_004818 [Phyllostomus discolor]|uniref:FAM192A/Fyv6 N-terminal domain-containing protein n=1 Tax=Phyllostomus discolor TaxID=89673 RepID=A0A833YQY1_9CHIR|nr:hypothetical protein HJG60_004818 [Phyllostomus discolor]
MPLSVSPFLFLSECPEEVYDPRSLYERLQEQKDRKQQEYEEQFKFKNMVRGLDEDETNFLDEVSRQQELIEKQRREEELKELKEYRINLHKVGISPENKKEAEKKVAAKPIETKNKFSQAKLLAGAVKHKSSESGNGVKRLKSDPDPDDKNPGGWRPSFHSLLTMCVATVEDRKALHL